MFRDREDAAHQLSAALRPFEIKNPLVLAIPCGGVVIGAILARELGAELDVILSHKLRAPDHPEQAIGAVSESGDLYLNDIDDETASIPDDYIHQEKQHQLSILANRGEAIRQIRAKALIAGRSVIVADDGIATGSTMTAALQVVRAQEPAALIVAIPVAPMDQIRQLERYCDRVVCLLSARRQGAVGQFYEEFPSVDEGLVIHILKKWTAKTP
jgi:hypothetical protein